MRPFPQGSGRGAQGVPPPVEKRHFADAHGYPQGRKRLGILAQNESPCRRFSLKHRAERAFHDASFPRRVSVKTARCATDMSAQPSEPITRRRAIQIDAVYFQHFAGRNEIACRFERKIML